MKSTPLPIVLQASAAAASFFHWGHHDEGIVKHYKAHGPFDNGLEAPIGWESACEAHGTFKARQYDLAVEGDRTRPLPFGLGPWEGAIKNFLHGRAYPGHFRGDKGEEDGSAHGSRKVFLTMEWTEVPRAVRRWVEDHQRKEWVDQHEHWMFAVLEHPQGDETIPSTLPPPPASTAVGEDGAAAAPSGRVVEDKDKVLFFAAGAIYELLPLWVAEGSQCESDLLDLSRYHPWPTDRGALAWVTDHSTPESKVGLKNIEFTVKAMTVALPDEARRRQEQYDKMLRQVKRSQRRNDREARREGGYKAYYEEVHEKDEL